MAPEASKSAKTLGKPLVGVLTQTFTNGTPAFRAAAAIWMLARAMIPS